MRVRAAWLRLTRVVSVVETDKLPVGKRARAAFVAAVEASDDRVERHYLEIKSGIDLNIQAHRRKVVKFILGAAHRDPIKASRHLEGHAIMVLGLPLEGVRGVEKFEVLDLEREIGAFAGPDPPGWDIDTVPVDGGRDIVLIIVDPPTGRIWPVLKDGEPLWSGDIYMRADGATRKANGQEVTAMLSRAATPDRVLDVSVEPVGGVEALVVDTEELRALIEWHAERLEALVNTAPSPWGRATSSLVAERRSRDAFLSEVDAWAAEVSEEPAVGLHGLAAQMSRPFSVRIVNNTVISLKEVRLDMTFSLPLTALDWERQGDKIDLFPDRPLDWGRDSILFPSHLDVGPFRAPDSYDGTIQISKKSPAELVVELKRLHAEQTVTTPDEDVVLVAFVGNMAEAPQTITVDWRLAAGEINEVLRGSFDLTVSTKDWRGPLHSVVSAMRGDGPAIDEA